ncbi:MAG: diguanylate cyclase [Spirochaetales bacterium]|nr:diguanylate cyclase [Spirochaetales bacterium]
MAKSKILFVDDDIKALKRFNHTFRAEFDVDTAVNAEQALTKIYSDCEYAVVVADMRMEDMNGVEFLHKIKRITPDTIRIMLTGYADFQTAIEAVNKGNIFRFLEKPCLNKDLRAVIKEGIEAYKQIKQVEEKAHTDSLTGLYNHNSIIEILEKYVTQAAAAKQPLSLAMIDLDHFKKVNDTYGHQTGDNVLVTIAQVIKEEIRETDNAGRYGGEEFLLVMPETDSVQAFIALERLRKRIESQKWEQQGLKLTMSAGVKQYMDETAVCFIKKTDDLLYLAKKKGRNRIEIFEAQAE